MEYLRYINIIFLFFLLFYNSVFAGDINISFNHDNIPNNSCTLSSNECGLLTDLFSELSLIGASSISEFCIINQTPLFSCNQSALNSNFVSLSTTLNLNIYTNGSKNISFLAKSSSTNNEQFSIIKINGMSLTSNFQGIPNLINLNSDGNGLGSIANPVLIPITISFDFPYKTNILNLKENSIDLFMEISP